MESWLRLETACNIIFIRKTVDIVEGRIVFVDGPASLSTDPRTA